jgi:DNA-binding transcriptional LysR family regulator
MDLAALNIFKAVAEEGSVTRAAARLHCVQSNVSARLAQLEESLGKPLFHRVGRRLVITPDGTLLLGYSDRLLQLADEARSAIQNNGAPAGLLRIGSMETTAAVRLPRVMAAYHSRYPQVELMLETGPTDQLLQAVLAHRLDAALVAAPLNVPELKHIDAFEEELSLITARKHAPVTSARQLAGRTLLVFRSGCSYRRRLENWFAEAGVAPGRIVEFGTFEAILGCVAAGMGVSLMPQAILQQRRLGKTIQSHSLPANIARVTTVLVWHKDIVQHVARQAFVDELIGQKLSLLRTHA